MSKQLRTRLAILGAMIALMAVLLVVLLTTVDPNQYRSTIEDAVYEATGLELNIAGDMTLSYRPYVGVILNDLRLRNPDRPQELASASVVRLRVDPGELLGGRLLVEELHIDGIHLNWYIDEQGDSWWMTERLSRSDEAGDSPSIGGAAALKTRFKLISLGNGSADLQDLQQGYFYTVRELELSSQDSNVANQPFPLQASFELIEPTAPAPWPITLSSSNRVDLEAGSVEISEIRMTLTPALVEGNLQMQGLFGEFSWEGQLLTNEFALDALIDNLLARESQATPPGLPGFRNDSLWQAQLQMELSGDARQIAISEMIATLGDMRVEMDAEYQFASGLLPTNLNFDIGTNNLDLSPYLPAATEQAGPSPADNEPFAPQPQKSSVFDLEIPENLWSDMNVQGSVSVDSLFVSGTQFGSINLFANVESGVLDLELQPTNVLNGSVEGNFRINSVPVRSEVTLELFTEQLDVANLALPFLSPGAVTGRLNMESRYSGTGSTLGDWLDSFGGASSFAITDNAVDIGVIKQVFTAIAALSPTGEAIQQWPDVIRFNEFNGYAIFEDGLDDDQQIKLRLDNFDISGTGGFDLDAGSFNYDLLFTVLGSPFAQTIPINERYHDVSWPVRCDARFDDPINQYCRPDLGQIREIFTLLSNNALQNRLDEVITDQAPEALQDSGRDLLRNLFQN
jgi:AsmA protein